MSISGGDMETLVKTDICLSRHATEEPPSMAHLLVHGRGWDRGVDKKAFPLFPCRRGGGPQRFSAE